MIVDVNGQSIEFPDNLSSDDLNKAVSSAASQLSSSQPKESAAQSSQQEPMTVKGGLSNLAKDALSNIEGMVKGTSMISPSMAILQGENPFSPAYQINQAKGLYEGVKSYPGRLLNIAKNPVRSLYNAPISTALDIAGVIEMGSSLGKFGVNAARGTANRMLPSILKGTAGVPEVATKIALEKPSILKQPSVPEEMLNDVVGKPVINAIQQTKKMVGEKFGKIYRKYAGMEGPMQEIIDTPIAQKINPVTSNVEVGQKLNQVTTPADLAGNPAKTKFVPGDMITEKRVTGYKPGQDITVPRYNPNYNDLLIDKNYVDQAFLKGDKAALDNLYKKYIGTNKSDVNALGVSNPNKLQILTRIKRAIQTETNFNKDPVTLRPIDTAKDAAFKTMSSNIDEIRGNLPNGKRLAVVDDAWKALNDLYVTLQKDLADPGKAKDTMMKIIKSDHTWLTSGKLQNKVKQIKKAEVMTGQRLLEPAMEELTRQVFKDWGGKGFTAQVLKGMSLVGGGAAFANPLLLPVAGATMASTSPRIIRGAIKLGQGAGRFIEGASNRISSNVGKAGLASAFRKKE